MRATGRTCDERRRLATSRRPVNQRRLTLAASAIRATLFLGSVHTPCSRWNDSDPRDHVGRPFFCGFFGADAGVACKHFTVEQQRHIACPKDDAPGKKAVKSYIVDPEHARLGT